mmetsp:Transcript_4697/g.13920  ORF Transcript_4697/g.13920 Transcript_4697/m.13920 type:complete len:417 (-) Transcript_4697:30-1280(-)
MATPPAPPPPQPPAAPPTAQPTPAAPSTAAAPLAPLAAARARPKRGWLDWSTQDWQRWQRAPRMTSPLEVGEGRALILMKAPLAERYEIALGGEANVFTVSMAVERVMQRSRRLSAVVDCTLRAPDFHDVREWDDWDVDRVAARAGRDLAVCRRFRDAAPRPADVDAAVRACGRAWLRPSVVALCSSDGCNTAGVVAVAALVDVCKVPPADALKAVTALRPLFSSAHAAFLRARYPELDIAPAAPPEWFGEADDGAEDEEEEAVEEAPAPAKRPRENSEASEGKAAAPRNKRPKLRSAPAAVPDRPRAHTLRVLGPDGKRTQIATLESTCALCPLELESRPDAYDKDLVKVAGLPSFVAKITCDPAKLQGLCKYLVARKKAAVLAAGPPRVYLPPQEVSDTVTLHYRADRMAAKPA